MILIHYNQARSLYALRLPRRALRILVGLLTGHADLSRLLALINVKSDVLCSLCQEEEESSLHFLGKCSATTRIRFELLGLFVPDGYSDLGIVKLKVKLV